MIAGLKDSLETIYGIAGGEDSAALYAEVQAAIDAVKAEGAEMVIATWALILLPVPGVLRK